jgi:hypothetical protein
MFHFREVPGWYWISLPAVLLAITAWVWIPLWSAGYRPGMRLDETEGVLREVIVLPCNTYKGQKSVKPALRYDYTVNNVAYSSDQWAPSSGCMHDEELLPKLRGLDVGGPVKVYYSRTTPSFAVLDKTFSVAYTIFYVWTIIEFILFGVWFRCLRERGD